jgi:hypothetical protein
VRALLFPLIVLMEAWDAVMRFIEAVFMRPEDAYTLPTFREDRAEMRKIKEWLR